MKVELLSCFGNDKMVVNVARVSYNKWSESEILTDSDIRLLQYLAKHEHTSPFRHPQLQFRIECPIYVERQLFKHQIGITTNSISGRYVDFSTSYDVPQAGEWRKQSASSKQGSEGLVDDARQQKALDKAMQVVALAEESYAEMLQMGICKEQARTILPLCLSTQFIWTGSLQAFIHLCQLRLKEDAQKETRELVRQMLFQVNKLGCFEYSLKAWNLLPKDY
jgi:thymidylate synthase (FAD)